MGFKTRSRVTTEEAMSRAEEQREGFEAYFWYLLASALGEGEANSSLEMMEEIDLVAPEDVTLANFQVACWFANGTHVATDIERAREHLEYAAHGTELDGDITKAIVQAREHIGLPPELDLDRPLGPAMPYTPGNVGIAQTDGGAPLRTEGYKRRPKKPLAPTEAIYGIEFTPDGASLLSGGVCGEILLWDAATQKPIRRYKNSGSCVDAIDFSPLGARAALSSSDSLWLYILDLEADEFTILKGHDHAAAARFLDGGSQLISADNGGVIKLWDLASKSAIASHKHEVSDDAWIWSMEVSPDERTLAVADGDYAIGLYSLPEMELLGVLKGHTHLIHGLAFDAEGRQLLSASRDNTVGLWDIASASLVRSFDDHTGCVYDARFIEGGFVSAGLDGRVLRTDLATGTATELGRTESIHRLALSGTRLAAGGNDNRRDAVLLFFDLPEP